MFADLGFRSRYKAGISMGLFKYNTELNTAKGSNIIKPTTVVWKYFVAKSFHG